MLKKLIHGLMFGAGFGVAFAIIYTAWITWALPKYLTEVSGSAFSSATSDDVITAAPDLEKEQKFLGSPAIYAGDFLDKRKGTLSSGNGNIVGLIRSNKQPVEGVRLRLALNGSVMSQWGVTGPDGKYKISVPFGEYRIDGYELDARSANQHLPGKIDRPSNVHSGAIFKVSAGNEGTGLNLDYVDPIIKIAPIGDVPLSKDIVAKWQPYPGAARYHVQIYENENLHDYVGRERVFTRSERPTVIEPMINLTSQGTPFKVGYYYTMEVSAEDDNGNVISETARQYTEKDFKVVE